MPAININDNAQILAALPALLGFAPESSIVALLIENADGQDSLRCVLRFDIDVNAAAQLTTAAAPAFHNVSGAVLVAICGDWILEHAKAALDVLRDSISALNITIHARLTTPDLDQPGHWTNIDTGARGPITSFRDSVFTAEKVFRGERITAARDQIVAEFTPTTNPVPLITDDPTELLVDTFETVAAIISGIAHADTYPDLATRIGILITANVHLRDTMLLLSIDHAGPAARLWTQLANQLSGVARIEALTLAAACYYAASDTIRTGIALDVAAHDANHHRVDFPRLADLLLTALGAGISPDRIREVLNSIGTRNDN